LKSIKFFILIFFVAAIEINAQYIQFSQYYSTPTILAPSFAGAVESSRISFNYRDQWAKINGIFVTYAMAYDINVPRVSSGFGVLLLRDQAGAGNLARTEVGVLYSWYALLNKNLQLYFRPGIQFKMSQRSIEFNKLLFADQITSDGPPYPMTIEPPPSEVKKTYVDATSSILFYAPSYWVGLSADHLFRPSDAFYDPDYKVPVKYSAFAGYKFKLDSKGKYGHRSSSSIQDWFFVSAYYRLQGNSDQMDFGGYWDHEPFTLGLWVRGLPYMNIVSSPSIDAVIIVVGYRIYNFTIGYSYDLTVSPLLTKTGGSHEISISYKFNTDLKSKKRYGPLPCPGY